MEMINKIKSFFSSSKNHSFSSSSRSQWSLFGFGGWNGHSNYDERVFINEGYLSNEDVFAVLDKLTNTSASIPIKLYEKQSDEWEEIQDMNNQLYQLLLKPNETQTLKEYRHEQYLNYLLTGDSFELMKMLIGFSYPTALNILPSQYVEIELEDQNKFFSPVKDYLFSYGGYRTVYGPEEILHSKILDPSYPSNQKGLSPLQPAYTSLSASNQVHNAEKSMIENKGATGMISSDGGDYPLSAEEKDDLDKQLKERIGGSNNYNKTITVGKSVKFQTLGLSPKDLALTEIDINKLRKFCNIYGLSSQLFNDTANSTYNNVSEAKASLYTESAIPLAQTFVDNWNENLIPIFNKRDGKEYLLKLDISKIEVLQKNKKEEAEKDKIVTESLLSVASMVSMNQLDRESGINILMYSHNLTEEEAESIIKEPIPQPQINENEG
jgi:HK97 family phage portal protein